VVDLAEFGMHESENVLIQDLENGTAMQVKLAPYRIDVRVRSVPIADANSTTSNTPEWTTAYNLHMAVWVREESPVWQWLKGKGINESGVYRRLLGLR
jgi:hypothetical protein